jgi:hypothetical protein
MEFLTTPVFLISATIIVVLAVRATYVVRQEKDDQRGSLPGKGDHIIEANYFSGGGGGGSASSYKVPKDPQDYAKAFVPRNKD